MWNCRKARKLLLFLNNYVTHQPSTLATKVLPTTPISLRFSSATQEQKEVTTREKIQLQRHSIKKVKRKPFVKGLFFGKIDTDLMAFPQILDVHLLKEIEYHVNSINELYAKKVNSNAIDAAGNVPEDVLHELKEMGLFGRLIPYEYNGLNLSYTALLRLNEALSLDWSLFTTIAAHEFLAVQAILNFGSAEQKQKYLPNMASGKCVGALCWSEAVSGSDLRSIETTASPAAGGNYSLTGVKHWVTNGKIADVFVVFAKMRKIRDEEENVISVFLVDRYSSGVTITPDNNTTGLRATGISTVEFTNVVVPQENLIGNEGDADKILLKTMEVGNLGMASFTFGTLKELLDVTTEHVINTVRFEKPMTALAQIRQRLAKIATTIYAMESTAYFTAGLMDSTEDPDCALECAILKVFNSEGTRFCIQEMKKILGAQTLLKGHVFERYYRDAEALESLEGTNDVARLYISLIGLHLVGQKKAEMVVQNRNSLFYPKEYIKTKWRQNKIMNFGVSYDQDVAGHLHPSLVIHANKLEHSVQRLEVLFEHVLEQHGRDVIHQQMDPICLANVVIDIYAMSAVLARSSRSYCIGLQNSDPEMRKAFVFCNEAFDRVDQNYIKVLKGAYENNNGHYMKIAEQIIDWRGYYAEHPLKHNH